VYRKQKGNKLKYNMALRKLNQEKESLGRDIRNLKRQVIAQKKVLKEQKQ
jgi:hypothetical protein